MSHVQPSPNKPSERNSHSTQCMPDRSRSLLFKAGRGAVDAQSRIISHQIDENDVDLRARITQITNTINSSNPLVGAGARQQQTSKNFFSYPSFRAVTIGGGHAAGQVLEQELSLLTLLNSLCSPGDMELPINDPSLLQPTPFAPGQNAHSLHHYQHQRRRRPLPAVIVAPVLVPVSVRVPTAPVAPLPVPAAIVAPVLFLAGTIPLTAVMPTATLPQKLSPANIGCDLSTDMSWNLTRPTTQAFTTTANSTGLPNQSYETAGTVSVGLGQLNSISPLAFAMNNINPSGRSSKKARVVGIAITRESRWNIRYNELLEFRSLHGHCRVPHGYPANPKLSWWVMNQRAQFAHQNQGRKTWLTEDRIMLLTDLGFIWNPHYNGGMKAAGHSRGG